MSHKAIASQFTYASRVRSATRYPSHVRALARFCHCDRSGRRSGSHRRPLRDAVGRPFRLADRQLRLLRVTRAKKVAAVSEVLVKATALF